ncbi:unnamed protein product [Nezara viridula]|uniref:Uncharacterized protein n=1 Tax=Nezara viridula TaxID=85310 RepID=A0A9P0HP04_NEZVI|nr:unnamed protein product [Nezara viridula]
MLEGLFLKMAEKCQINKVNEQRNGAMKDEHTAKEITDFIHTRIVKEIKCRINTILSMGLELGKATKKIEQAKKTKGKSKQIKGLHNRRKNKGHRVKRNIFIQRSIRAMCPKCHMSWKMNKYVRKKIHRQPVFRCRCGKYNCQKKRRR